MFAPVIIFVYVRPEHTIKTIEALSINRLAKETNVFIFSDAPKNDKVIDKVKEVREYIDSLQNRKLFKSITIKKAEENMGLANSVISGVNEIINEYGRVIVVEDDLITSVDFLEYMNDALEYYENDNEIWSISGYTFKIDIPKNYKSDVYISYRGCSWGWATWRNRWNKVDWDVKDYEEFKLNNKLRKKFNRGGRDMSDMLDNQMAGKIDSWAIRWCYAQFKLDMLTVYPIVSRVKNIGLDGSGTHSGVTVKFDTILSDGKSKCIFDKPRVNRHILKNFKDYYGTSFDYFIIGIKKLVKKLLNKLF
jgi:hypothetical protein